MDLEYFEEWVLKDFGINLKAYKQNQLQRRILSLMSRVGVNSVEEYINLLKKDKDQRIKFLDFITINVSEFFRNPEIFDELEKKIKVELLNNTSGSLKIWSAACSIGAEPYSLSIIMDEISPNKKHKIIATDLDMTILQRAKEGIYAQAEIKNVKKERLEKYFTKEGEKYKIKSSIKNVVTFKKHDLILDNYEKDFDLIVCRNVVIYFNQDIKDNIYKKFSESLKKGGLLFVGATESIYNYKDYGFEKVSTFIYRKI
ncbi:chemotaxis protein CheR [Clostridium sporogenes]|jgi:chemotaxis protein methyltransferase CheR|uniref:protein-glutamate O-methyltransferase n=1 Tax=Clostridium sporogenes TaxID=1509 RepID=A0ABD6RTF2_CLOSG|nr:MULTISPECIES: protein-glutamate O-methyltransferase CheR [Clostridium]MBE6077785.1 protein-glutamate O-methyltransferase CheR [Clostridium lundense]AVQ44434.1 protein-glutamate O-methyltransferase CheR [Clostridium botulinum]AVQ47977.1 protein-glutamate O-methyltransferase CheR [Clostridium botulinum]EDU36104.1 CheR methyltransferase, SAM binding domain protein [Clostridium sporogenes ATCC 15579]MCR1975512.1 protein-glutamate O-methyltransferase CheR [Clostridium sporogenes]